MRFNVLGGMIRESPPFVANSDPPIKNTMGSVLVLFTVIILKRVREIIFFQSNRFTECKFRYRKELAKSLLVFNQSKIIRPIQSKKYLRT